MEHLARMQLVGKITYYLGWVTALCGALAHFTVATRVFALTNLSKRNFLEASVLFFLICTASELRALVPRRTQEPQMVERRQAA